MSFSNAIDVDYDEYSSHTFCFDDNDDKSTSPSQNGIISSALKGIGEEIDDNDELGEVEDDEELERIQSRINNIFSDDDEDNVRLREEEAPNPCLRDQQFSVDYVEEEYQRELLAEYFRGDLLQSEGNEERSLSLEDENEQESAVEETASDEVEPNSPALHSSIAGGYSGAS